MGTTPKQPAFTLAELLIALAILGVIATFTIPKILDSGSSSKHNAIAKEAAAMVSGAYQNYKLQSSASASTTFGDFTPYMNYVKIDTITVIDSYNNDGSRNCSDGTRRCILMHNGALIRYPTNISFGATAVTSGIWFFVDPDGTYSGVNTGSSKSVLFWIYYNGGLRSFGTILPNTQGSISTWNPSPNSEPEYFSWSN